MYLENEDGQQSFWGIVSVTLDFPEVLSGSPVERVADQGFACEVWRINPDTGERQTILMSETAPRPGREAVSLQQELFNADWTITLSPLRPWYARPSLWLYLAIGLLLSLLAAAGTYNLERVRLMQAEAARREILQLQTQLEHEQTDMLLSQIRSHFFYHTLNSLQALIVLRPDDAYKMAGDFSRYLRFTLDAATAAGGMGSFKEELRAGPCLRRYQPGPAGRPSDHGLPRAAGGGLSPAGADHSACGGKRHPPRHQAKGGRAAPSPYLWRKRIPTGASPWPTTVWALTRLRRPEAGAIGLSNVRRPLSRFPGCGIEIESAPGRGTRVLLSYRKESPKILTDSRHSPQ